MKGFTIVFTLSFFQVPPPVTNKSTLVIEGSRMEENKIKDGTKQKVNKLRDWSLARYFLLLANHRAFSSTFRFQPIPRALYRFVERTYKYVGGDWSNQYTNRLHQYIDEGNRIVHALVRAKLARQHKRQARGLPRTPTTLRG